MREHAVIAYAVIACVHSSSRYVQLKTKQGAVIAPIQSYHYKGAVGVVIAFPICHIWVL